MPNCVYPTQYPLGMLVPFTPTSKPKETHLHQLYLYYWGLLVHIVLGPYPGLLRPALIHCTQHPSSFWLVSIVLSIPWACLYLLYSSYSVFFRPACTHPTHIQGLLRPACIHHTQCSLGLLMPIVSTSMPIQACLYLSYPHPGQLRPVCIHCTWCPLGLLIPIVAMPMPIQAYPYPSHMIPLELACTYCIHIQGYSGLLISITLSVLWACSYWSHPHPELLRSTCIHHTWCCSGLLMHIIPTPRPACIHHTQCSSGQLVPIILRVPWTCLYPLYSHPGLLWLVLFHQQT